MLFDFLWLLLVLALFQGPVDQSNNLDLPPLQQILPMAVFPQSPKQTSLPRYSFLFALVFFATICNKSISNSSSFNQLYALVFPRVDTYLFHHTPWLSLRCGMERGCAYYGEDLRLPDPNKSINVVGCNEAS